MHHTIDSYITVSQYKYDYFPLYNRHKITLATAVKGNKQRSFNLARCITFYIVFYILEHTDDFAFLSMYIYSETKKAISKLYCTKATKALTHILGCFQSWWQQVSSILNFTSLAWSTYWDFAYTKISYFRWMSGLNYCNIFSKCQCKWEYQFPFEIWKFSEV